MSRKTISSAVVGAAAVLALTACSPADGGPSSPTPTFSTLPASSSTSTPLEIAGAEQIMTDFWFAHDRCGNSGNSGLPIDPAQCSRASGMMSTLPAVCVSGYPDNPADVEKCAAALRTTSKPSVAPATAAPIALPPLHDDPTATMSDVAMVHALSTALPRADFDALDWKSARSMGSQTMQDYRAWGHRCEASGTVTEGCGARDIRRSSLPSRCVIEAESVSPSPDAPALCGIALLYVQHIGGGK